MGSNFSLYPNEVEDQPFIKRNKYNQKTISPSNDEEIEVLTDAFDPLFPVVILEKRNTKKMD